MCMQAFDYQLLIEADPINDILELADEVQGLCTSRPPCSCALRIS